MSNLSTHREPPRNGANGAHRHTPTMNETDPSLDLLDMDDDLRQEMQRLAAVNRELLGQNGAPASKSDTELSRLKAENSVLRRRLTELEQHLQALLGAEDAWTERQKEYEALLEEKSEVIRELHQKVQDGPRRAADEPVPKEEQLLALKKQLEQDRDQLKEDEETLMQQMRQMELSMAKDRAELARQRNELQRLHNELTREIEMAARDGSLRERLQALQRRQQDSLSGKSSVPPPRPAPESHTPPPAAMPQPEEKKSSGLFRRLFGA